MGFPSTFVVISFIVLIGCSLSAATRDFQNSVMKEMSGSKTFQVLTGLASTPMESPPSVKREVTDGGEEFISNKKYFTKDIIREPDNICWHKNEEVHPVPQTTKGLSGDPLVSSPSGQNNVKNNVYFTKNIREPDFTWWRHKRGGQKNVYFSKDLIREPDFLWHKNGGQKNVNKNVYFTKDLIREPDLLGGTKVKTHNS